MQPYVWQADRALQPFVDAATADSDTVGLLLSGSRGAGFADDESDYDLYRVVSDEAYDRRHEQGQPLKVTLPPSEGRASVELMYTCPRRLAELAAQPGWWTAGYATAPVLLDKTGQLAPILAAMKTLPDDWARADAARREVRLHLPLRAGGVRPVLPGQHDRQPRPHAPQVR